MVGIKAERELRAAFSAMDRADLEAGNARGKIHDLVHKQVEIHGAAAVVEWLKTRQPLQLGFKGELFTRVVSNLPGRFGKQTLARLLCDAYAEMKKETRT